MNVRHFPILALSLALAASACAGAPIRPTASAAAPAFEPMRFFLGHTEGDGTMKVVLSRRRKVHIASDGRLASDGSLQLVQHIETEGKKARTRRWSLRSTGPGTYAAVLTDAVGPVLVGVAGNLLHIRFRARGNLTIEQWVALKPGGRVAQNRLVVRKFGVQVAVLQETIRKID